MFLSVIMIKIKMFIMSYLGKNLGNWQAETLLLREVIRSIFDEKTWQELPNFKIHVYFVPSIQGFQAFAIES